MKKRGFLTIMMFVVFWMAWESSQHAMSAAFDLRCDTGVYERLQRRARLQGHQDVTNAQNLIFKPDSVLEYTCFQRFAFNIIGIDTDYWPGMTNVRYASGLVPSGSWPQLPSSLFSPPASGSGPTMYERGLTMDPMIGSPSFGGLLSLLSFTSTSLNIPALFPGTIMSMPEIIPYGNFKSLMETPSKNYLYDNFNHTFMGGRQGSQPSMMPPRVSLEYVCDAMEVAWSIAKCENFAAKVPSDGFYDLGGYISAVTNILGDEIRKYPNMCLINPWLMSTGGTPVMGSSTSIIGSAPATDCGQKIPTGLTITTQRNTDEPAGRPVTYEEKICSNPTCTYVPTSLTAGNCVYP